ncbi:hypothetical protein [Myroides sp. DW712]|uniref:hypothetical protein n=1 Tax=Myroides sp. DW712 TaxID=3389800 RepID=UPI00397BA3D3
MASPSSESFTYQNKTDEEYFIYFYEEVLKAFLPPRYKATKLKELPEIDLRKVLDKCFLDKEFNENMIDHDSKKTEIAFRFHLRDLLELITNMQLEKIKIDKITVSHYMHEIIKTQLLKFHQEQCIKILYYIKNFDSIETRAITLFNKRKNIFVNEEASSWFLKTLEHKFDVKNGRVWGLNAFVNALINNDDVKNHILIKSCTQKKVVEYLNVFYEKEVIKNNTRLSDPKRYITEVNELIKEHLNTKKWRY